MRIIIDIGHPAHVHLFRNMITKLQSNGHIVLVTARDKEVTLKLLNNYNLDFKIRPSSKNNIIGKIFGIFLVIYCLWKYNRYFKADVMIGGVGNAYIAILGFITGKPTIIFDDTEHSKYEMFIVKLFSTTILTPDCYTKNIGIKQIKYSGYHELAYLHPNYFKADYNVRCLLGISKDEKYVIMRFVSWKASHDIGHSGLTLEMKLKAVKEFSKYAKVFISSEAELPEELKQYQIKITPEKMHDVLAFATLYIGEGATMASECAVLGTPAIYINSLQVGYCTEQENKYQQLFNFREQNGVLEKAKELLQISNLKEEYQSRRMKMLEDKIDVTAFMVWFIENYPESVKIMKENPEYQMRFK